ncbi:hypothetical protein BDF20DRAFT_830973 [Mycotypha africana]|uniref:uncharacterized protein n=1 Tax=Mycotypha africana TaxID=64632 RepID=UPI002301A747|nr:uncharacterized protein BDF20DRAFT_830973 [Mycotypha africana]KAI8990884.1 hypothetical protein BDF20DRAFT_830973 [Mycotypha africana]
MNTILSVLANAASSVSSTSSAATMSHHKLQADSFHDRSPYLQIKNHNSKIVHYKQHFLSILLSSYWLARSYNEFMLPCLMFIGRSQCMTKLSTFLYVDFSTEPSVTKPLKSSNLIKSTKSYSIYSDTTRESFIDRMLEQPQERGLVAKVARELNVKYRTALNWWHIYEEMEGVPYKNSEKTVFQKAHLQLHDNEYINQAT